MAELSDLQKKFNGAKVKKDSINEIQKVILEIHNNFDSFSTPDIRALIRRIRNIHPFINEYLGGLPSFQPVSEEMGARTILHKPDTQSLDLQDWANDYRITDMLVVQEAPYPMRTSLLEKVKVNCAKMISDAYLTVNNIMANNISNEYYMDDPENPIEKRPPINLPHSYRLAGDSRYTTDVLDEDIKNAIVISLTNYLSKIQMKLIDHQSPVVQSIRVGGARGKPTRVEKMVEGKQIFVDIKGNKITPNTGVNDDVLNETALA